MCPSPSSPRKKPRTPLGREPASSDSRQPRRLGILAVPRVQMLDVSGPMDVFMQANRAMGDAAPYAMQVISLTRDVTVAQNGMRFVPDLSIHDAVGDLDTLLVAGSPTIREHEENIDLRRWLVAQSQRVRRLGAICTGAFLLARAGLLDGRRATTHWYVTDSLAAAFPRVRVEPNPIYVKDGSVYTSAGVTASMDLALALLEEDHGRKVALRVAKELVLFLKRPGDQSQFSMQLAAQASEGGPLDDTQEWILANLSKELPVDRLARRLHMSTRNFARLFKQELHTTPRAYVEAARVEAAQRLLEDGKVALKKVASVCGFSDQGGLRRAFLRRICVTPADYRDRFRSTCGR
jgi:transcriptional regulator GlxA family with amidase domain